MSLAHLAHPNLIPPARARNGERSDETNKQTACLNVNVGALQIHASQNTINSKLRYRRF